MTATVLDMKIWDRYRESRLVRAELRGGVGNRANVR